MAGSQPFELTGLDHVVLPRGLFLGPLTIVLCVLATTEAVSLMRAVGAKPSIWATYSGALLPVTIVAATPYLELVTGTGELRPDSMLVPALRFLQECDWVDLSRGRDRVWLRSPIRSRLANL